VLSGDALFWLLEAQQPRVDAAGKVDVGQQDTKNNTVTYGGPDASFQTTADWYRHGKYPSLNGPQFTSKGGKVSYNLLYCDGHVAQASDKADTYKGIRMRFPG
jgi:prepilin-type processing-associated H-X9-DG protein